MASAVKNTEIRTSSQVTVADKNSELISDVLSNWSGKSSVLPGSKIMSYKQLIDVIKTTNKVDFDDFDTKKKALEAANASLAAIQGGGNAAAIASAQGTVQLAKSELDKIANKIKTYIPQ